MGAFEQPEDQNFAPKQSRHASRPTTSPWHACLLLSITFGVLAGLAALSVLPGTPVCCPSLLKWKGGSVILDGRCHLTLIQVFA